MPLVRHYRLPIINYQCNRQKLTISFMSTGTATPSFVPASKSHCLTATIAAGSNPFTPDVLSSDLATRTLPTVPSGITIASSSTRALEIRRPFAALGYTAGTCFLMTGGTTPGSSEREAPLAKSSSDSINGSAGTVLAVNVPDGVPSGCVGRLLDVSLNDTTMVTITGTGNPSLRAGSKIHSFATRTASWSRPNRVSRDLTMRRSPTLPSGPTTASISTSPATLAFLATFG